MALSILQYNEISMPSRRKRKRDRRRAEATDTSPEKDLQGDWGADAGLTRSDIALIKRACREDWPTSPENQEAILDELQKTLEQLSGADRLAIAISRFCVYANGRNIDADIAALRASE
jgi:hypothetical protein